MTYLRLSLAFVVCVMVSCVSVWSQSHVSGNERVMQTTPVPGAENTVPLLTDDQKQLLDVIMALEVTANAQCNELPVTRRWSTQRTKFLERMHTIYGNQFDLDWERQVLMHKIVPPGPTAIPPVAPSATLPPAEGDKK
jgi:hypothetical protein